jgi:hypothetical protein
MKYKFLTLWSAGLVSTILALPYIFALQHDAIAQATMPFFYVVLVSLGQSALLLTIAVFFGLKLSQKIGLPVLALFESSVPFKEKIKSILKLSVPLGIAVALIIKFGDFFFIRLIPQLAGVDEHIPFWKSLLVAPYGGVVEELLMRLFLVTLFAWLLGKVLRNVTKSTDIIHNNTVMWTAIIAASVLFGLGHLPATATILPLTPIVVARAILLNGIGGIVFGWLYWKKGLEYAIAAHFTADIVLHAILPVVLK